MVAVIAGEHTNMRLAITNEIRDYFIDNDMVGVSFHCRALAEALLALLVSGTNTGEQVRLAITNEIRDYFTDNDMVGASFHCRALADDLLPILRG